MKLCSNTIRDSFSRNVIRNYNDLKSGKNLQDAIEKAYGPKGICILKKDMEFCLLIRYLASLKRDETLFHCFGRL